jgi:hypothetical protein
VGAWAQTARVEAKLRQGFGPHAHAELAERVAANAAAWTIAASPYGAWTLATPSHLTTWITTPSTSQYMRFTRQIAMPDQGTVVLQARVMPLTLYRYGITFLDATGLERVWLELDNDTLRACYRFAGSTLCDQFLPPQPAGQYYTLRIEATAPATRFSWTQSGNEYRAPTAYGAAIIIETAPGYYEARLESPSGALLTRIPEQFTKFAKAEELLQFLEVDREQAEDSPRAHEALFATLDWCAALLPPGTHPVHALRIEHPTGAALHCPAKVNSFEDADRWVRETLAVLDDPLI